jgi:glycosyltransferase involved in cell wall biosynthesis
MTPNRMPLVSVVVPVLNEAGHLGELLSRLRTVAELENAYRFEFVFVDDGSGDGTVDALCAAAAGDPRVKILEFTRNFGHQVALTAGLTESAGDAVVTLDGDLQHPPELIHAFLRAWERGAQVVLGVRKGRHASWFKRKSASAFYALINRWSDVPVVPEAADFRLLSRPAVAELLRLRERARFLRGLVGWIGYEPVLVPYDEGERQHGSTRYSLGRMLWLAADALTSFSAVPLRMSTLAGALTSAAAAAYGLYVLAMRLLHPERIVSGWTSLVLTLLILGGIQLFSLGIVGEYLYRIYDEVKGRPLYVIRRRVGFEETLEVGEEAVSERGRAFRSRESRTVAPS